MKLPSPHSSISGQSRKLDKLVLFSNYYSVQEDLKMDTYALY